MTKEKGTGDGERRGCRDVDLVRPVPEALAGRRSPGRRARSQRAGAEESAAETGTQARARVDLDRAWRVTGPRCTVA